MPVLSVPLELMTSFRLPSKRSQVWSPSAGAEHTPALTANSTFTTPTLPAASMAAGQNTCQPGTDVSRGDPGGTPKPQSATPDVTSVQVNADGTVLDSSNSCCDAGVVTAMTG